MNLCLCTLAANFKLLLSMSPYKTPHALRKAADAAKMIVDDAAAGMGVAPTEEQQILAKFPTERTLYNILKGLKKPNASTLDCLVTYYNLLKPPFPATPEEFLTTDLSLQNRYFSNSKHSAFTGLYSCYYLTLYDKDPVGALLYLDVTDLRAPRAILITEIDTDEVLQDPALEAIIQMPTASDKDREHMKKVFLDYKGDLFERSRLQLMLSTSVEVTNKSLSVDFAHIDDPKKQLHLGLNIERFVAHRTLYHGGMGLFFSNHNTVNGLCAYRTVLASRTHILPIPLLDKNLFQQLRRGSGDILQVSDQRDALCFRFLSTYKKNRTATTESTEKEEA